MRAKELNYSGVCSVQTFFKKLSRDVCQGRLHLGHHASLSVVSRGGALHSGSVLSLRSLGRNDAVKNSFVSFCSGPLGQRGTAHSSTRSKRQADCQREGV